MKKINNNKKGVTSISLSASRNKAQFKSVAECIRRLVKIQRLEVMLNFQLRVALSYSHEEAKLGDVTMPIFTETFVQPLREGFLTGMIHFVSNLGSLRSYYGDAEDNVDQKMNLYFTYESRDTLNLFCLFITVKAITKLNLGHRNKFEIEFQKNSRRSSRSPHNAEFGHLTLLFCRGRQLKEMYKEL